LVRMPVRFTFNVNTRDEACDEYMHAPDHAPNSCMADTTGMLRGVKRALPVFLQPEGDNCTRTSQSILAFAGAQLL